MRERCEKEAREIISHWDEKFGIVGVGTKLTSRQIKWIEDLITTALLKREKEIEELKQSEEDLSDAYLRIRRLLGAWNTKHGGVDRFEVTENKIKDLQEKLKIAREVLCKIYDKAESHSDIEKLADEALQKISAVENESKS